MNTQIQAVVHFAPEICAFCGGNGGGRCRDGKVYDSCPVCNGIGSILVAQMSKKCSFCNGQGGGHCRDGYDYDACPACKGTGWAYVYQGEKPTS